MQMPPNINPLWFLSQASENTRQFGFMDRTSNAFIQACLAMSHLQHYSLPEAQNTSQLFYHEARLSRCFLLCSTATTWLKLFKVSDPILEELHDYCYQRTLTISETYNWTLAIQYVVIYISLFGWIEYSSRHRGMIYMIECIHV